MGKQILLNDEQFEILKVAKKKKRLTFQEFSFWTLQEMVHKTVLDKVIPSTGKYAGWPYFKISHRGKKYLKREREQGRKTSLDFRG